MNDVLIISGITLDDVVSSNVDMEYNNNYLDAILTTNNYNRLPETFKSISDWPTITNLHCWNCTLSINTPIPIPSSICNIDRDKHIFTLEGIACSFKCAYRYIKDMYNLDVKRVILLQMLQKEFGDKYPLVPALSRYTLKKFGGVLTDEEYKLSLSQY